MNIIGKCKFIKFTKPLVVSLSNHSSSYYKLRASGRLALLCLTPLIHPVSLDLKILSMDGGILKEAGVGQPFMAYITAHEAQNVTMRPTLDHSSDINVRANGYQMNMINGNTTVVYQFQVRIDAPGTFTIGPAQLTHEGQSIKSNVITVTATQEQKIDQIKKASAASLSNNFLRLTADKQRAYVGEKIICTLTFYTNDNNVSLQALYDPDQLEKTGFNCKPKSEPINGITQIDGHEYRYAQWQFETYATKSGNMVLPAYSIDFITQTSRGMFAMLFAHHDVKRLYSNTLNLSIDPLPHGKREPSFVGTISQFTAKLSPAHTQVGKGMILSLSITGQGNFENIPFIPLTHMNEDFKWYESKQYTQSAKDGDHTHVMEYVIQATTPGTYSIPNQEFFYFDTKERTYKLIKTLEIPLHITPGPSLTHTKKDVAPSPSTPSEKDYEHSWRYYLPWTLYWIIIGCVACAGMVGNLYYFMPRLKRSSKKLSIKQYKNEIYKIEQLQHYQSLYPLFTHYCAQQSHLKPQEVTDDAITQWLSQSGLSAQLIQEWNQFFNEITQLRFTQSATAQNHTDMIKRAFYWLDILAQLPRGNS